MHAKSVMRRGATTIATMTLGQKGHWDADDFADLNFLANEKATSIHEDLEGSNK